MTNGTPVLSFSRLGRFTYLKKHSSYLSEAPGVKAFAPALVYFAVSAVLTLLYWYHPGVSRESLLDSGVTVFGQGGYHRLVSGMLLHSTIAHFLSNMFFILLFGGLLTAYFGFLVFPVVAVILGLATQAISLATYPDYMNLVGSSGLVFVLYGLWMPLFMAAERHVARSRKWVRILGFSALMFIPSSFSPRISYRTHYIGLALGLAAGIALVFALRKRIRRRNAGHWDGLVAQELKRVRHDRLQVFPDYPPSPDMAGKIVPLEQHGEEHQGEEREAPRERVDKGEAVLHGQSPRDDAQHEDGAQVDAHEQGVEGGPGATIHGVHHDGEDGHGQHP